MLRYRFEVNVAIENFVECREPLYYRKFGFWAIEYRHREKIVFG